MSDREFIHDIVLQVAVLIAFFAIMGAITSWNCARCDKALAGEPASTEQEVAR